MQTMNHWQRVEAAIQGLATDRTPVAMWRHFPDEDRYVPRLVNHSIEWQQRWDFDLVKFMPSGTYGVEDWGAVSAYRGALNGAREVVQPAVRTTEDWARIQALDVREGSYGRQNEALGAVAKALGGHVPLLQTVFSPLTTARKLSTDRLYSDLRCHPEAVEAALEVITETTIEFALQAIERGAHGVFLATQQASYRLLTAAEYERFGRRYDLRVLEALRGKARLNMLHAHGDEIMFEMLTQYPVEMLNWHDRLTEPSLAEAHRLFPGLLVGGLAEHGLLLSGSEREIQAQVHDAQRQTGGTRLMLGPGCVLPVTTPAPNIQAVIDAAACARQEQALAL